MNEQEIFGFEKIVNESLRLEKCYENIEKLS